MRITGGTLRGRRLKTPTAGGLRPTQDAVREAVFSMLSNVVAGSRFLDLFAGTGAVGIEAFSRGATSVTWLEKEPRNFRLLQENMSALCSDSLWLKAVCADVFQWLARAAMPAGARAAQLFDIVYADPPYESESSPDRTAEIMGALAAAGIVAEGAFFVAEQRATVAAPVVAGWEPVTERRYGRTKIMMYRKCLDTFNPDS